MLIKLISAIAAVAAGNAQPTDAILYTMTIETERQDEEMRHVSTYETVMQISDGPFSLTANDDGSAPLLHGSFTVDEEKGEIFAALTVCKQDADPCEAIAKPAILFKIGEGARLDVGGDASSVKISLMPVGS